MHKIAPLENILGISFVVYKKVVVFHYGTVSQLFFYFFIGLVLGLGFGKASLPGGLYYF